ncbi:MAG: peptidase M30, partial [Spirochaetes bacterium]|nr:peptidase M30 [Spirochaetota bacterium]
WEYTDYWPEEMYSTLAHEFQHMIHFYQRAVLRDAMADDDTWINEMASQVVEDLLADKMAVIGPRGVEGTIGTAGSPGNTEGRLPMFNKYNDVSLSHWIYSPPSESLKCYSITYAFGAWLARNYGGAELLNRLMQCELTGPASIEDIVSQDTGRTESFSRILQRWSAAQLLSDVTDAPPGYQYNTGGFVQSSVGSNDYALGSINLFNYSPAPSMYSGSGTVGTSQHLSTSMKLYLADVPASGALDLMLDMPSGLIASVVVK